MLRKALGLSALVVALTTTSLTTTAFAQMPGRYANYGYYGAAQPVYGPPTTFASNYYAGNPCGQRVARAGCCGCNHGCDPCSVNYVAASPCAPQCAPACGRQISYSPVVANPYGPQVRRGLLGQPVLHVPGQPVRNVLRFLAP